MNPSLSPTVPNARAPARAGTGTAFTLTVASDARVALARGWLWLALASLLGSGLFSVLLVAARTPGLNRLFDRPDFFRVALVVHVDLSVLVWFCALAGLLWTLNCGTRGLRWGWLALAACAAGAALMALAPLAGTGDPVMANYIPLLDDAVFVAALLVFGGGVALLVLRALLVAPAVGAHLDAAAALRFGLNASVIATAVALLAFGWSWAVVPRTLDARTYYEILFWGGGHALQFAWTLLLLVAWLWLAGACGVRVPLSPRLAVALFALALLSVFVTPVAYLVAAPTTVEHRELHTWAMRIGGGVAVVPAALAVLVGLGSQPRAAAVPAAQRPLRAALLSSMLLFAAGGLIGVFISGSNVRVPAHYHGSIVGVTLALMGLVLLLLPRLGYRVPQGRLASAQPWVYGLGQLLHILGLVWSGGYGVQRKVAGSEQVLRSFGEVAGMGLMGLGGAVAIVGGLLFVWVVVRALRAPAREAG